MKRRDCSKVIEEMVSHIPLDKTELLKELGWNSEDASYKAPEETLQWERTQQTLIKYIPKPAEKWEFEVLSIFTALSIDDLKSSAL